MNIGIFGTGNVGITIANKLLRLGHHVMLGSRSSQNEKGLNWAKSAGANASFGTYAEAAAFGEVLFHCTLGFGAVDAIKSAGAANLHGKILVDITNPLDFSKGMPPTLFVTNDDSLGEQIQRAVPEVHVVKALNTVNAELMVNPALIPGNHTVFICGNDENAKTKVTEILSGWFGWKSVIDLGDITNSRAVEGILPIWIRLMIKLGTPFFNFQINVQAAN